MTKSPLRAKVSWLYRRTALQMAVFTVVCVVAAHAGVARAATRDSLEGVVQITAYVPQEARTASTLGTERQGSGVVIDDSGLILTIGYLVVEAAEVEIDGGGPEPIPASIVAYDHESGFGLVRAQSPLQLAPIPLGASADVRTGQPLLVVSRTGDLDAAGVYVVDRR